MVVFDQVVKMVWQLPPAVGVGKRVVPERVSLFLEVNIPLESVSSLQFQIELSF